MARTAKGIVRVPGGLVEGKRENGRRKGRLKPNLPAFQLFSQQSISVTRRTHYLPEFRIHLASD